MTSIKWFLPILLVINISNVLSRNKNCFHWSQQEIDINSTEPTTQLENYKSCGSNKVCVPKVLCINEQISIDETKTADLYAVLSKDDASSALTETECDISETCCAIPNKTNDSTVATTTPESTLAPVTSQPYLGCGYRNSNGNFSTVGDNDDNDYGPPEEKAKFAEFPWMVGILRDTQDPLLTITIYYCGGALIAPTVVVTTANCIQHHMTHKLIVRAGVRDFNRNDEPLPHQNRQVREIILHENFDSKTNENDIALLIVDSPFDYDANVRPICLPPPHARFNRTRCFVTGWYREQFLVESDFPKILKKYEAPIVAQSQCQTDMRSTPLGNDFNLHESFICAQSKLRKFKCNREGGAPLVCSISNRNEQYYHVGMASWDLGHCQQNIPAVYSNVAKLRPWINEKLAERDIDFSHFTA